MSVAASLANAPRLVSFSSSRPGTLWLVVCLMVIGVSGCSGRDEETTTANDSAAAAGVTSDPSVETTPSGPPAAPVFDRLAELKRAQQAMASRDADTAIESLGRVLLSDPGDVEALFFMARIEASRGQLEEAITLLDSIPKDHPEAGLPALGQSADWAFQLERYDDAESRYQEVLKRAPAAGVAHRQLAYLYNRQGRRHEAAEHLRQLCRLGDVRQDELHALMVLSNAVYQKPSYQPPPGERPYWPIGPMAEARKLYADYQFVEAADLLHPVIERSEPNWPALNAFYGRLLAETQDDERFLWWYGRTDESIRQFSEYWAAVGTYLTNHRRYEEAVRALAEAIDRDPTDAASIRRMNEALLALEKPNEAEPWFQRFSKLRETTLASNKIGESSATEEESFRTVIAGLNELGRPLEAMMWEVAAAFRQQPSPAEMQQINVRLKQTLSRPDPFPDQQTRLCGLDKSRYPEPKLKGSSTRPTPETLLGQGEGTTAPRFANVASAYGIDHTFQIAEQPQPFRFALYQTLGGGVAVTDFDLDGLPDLYLAQGAAAPPRFRGRQSNRFYRNLSGTFLDVTEASGTEQRQYSIGVTAGDWNQDGFDDLVVSGIGGAELLVNNGDGSFAPVTLWRAEKAAICTSSLAIADLTGDAIADIYEVLYVDDPAMTELPALDQDGNVLGVAVASYNAARDQIHVNDGAGGFAGQPISLSSDSASTGLGVVVTDFDGRPGNEVFVGNDIRANHLWARSQQGEWSDVAAVLGCAFGNGGILTASMGVALADFDNSGTPDLHVTNFQLEPASLFINRGGSFDDRAIPYRLATPSRSVLGFGTQGIDFDNDGRRDLVVTNGHVEKPSNPNEPFHQRPQLFANQGNRFALVDVEDSSGYWQGAYLGRGLAKLDFDRDGSTDFVITHIGSPTALIRNETESGHRWLDVRLVGTESERDAVGARVEVKAGGEAWSDWVTAGDGYLARNEPALHFGLGHADAIDEVVVTWPSGRRQSFSQVPIDRRVLLVENAAEPYFE